MRSCPAARWATRESSSGAIRSSADPSGRILVQAGQDEAVLVADCDLAQVDTVRTHWPFLRDRRIDAYDGI